MTTELHTQPTERMTAMNSTGNPTAHASPGQVSTPEESPAAPAGNRFSDLPARDLDLLDLMVHMSLRLRLRGVDLEITTGLVGRELDLVALLTSGGPTSVKSLVADLGLPRSTMTAIVDRLQERGLVTRHPNPQDRRSVVLEATPAAQEALSRYHEGLLGLVEHIKKVMPESDQDEFSRLLRKMSDGF